MLSRDQMPVQTMEVKIRPREQHCDQVFRFYEPQSSKVFIRLPKGFAPFFALAKGMTVRTSLKDVEADLNFETGEVSLVVQTEQSPKLIECYVYLYQDTF